nr:disulfide bond formation protein DsbB [Shewanella submarina]
MVQEFTVTGLTRFAQSRLAWYLLGGSALLLEATALFFQYVMHLNPCVMCVYQRVAVLGILLAGLLGSIAPKSMLRFPAYLLWIVSAGWGLMLATELYNIQSDPSPFATCDFMPNFPESLPLHDWLPQVFMPTGMCTDDVWGMLGLSMTQWMQIAFSIYLIMAVVFLLPLFRKAK